jgi:hypothetical protein
MVRSYVLVTLVGGLGVSGSAAFIKDPPVVERTGKLMERARAMGLVENAELQAGER